MKRILYQRKEKAAQEKPQKEKKEKKKEEKSEKAFQAKTFLYCFAATFILYAVMLVLEKAVIEADARIDVYVAAAELEEDVTITPENAGEYFVKESRSIAALPEGYITDITAIMGKISAREYIPKEIVTVNGFRDISEVLTDIVNPVEVSLNANVLSQVVGGVLRAGDYINIWSVKETGTGGEKEIEAVQICKSAYVSRAFTASGEQVDRSDADEQATTVINIIIPAASEEDFNTALASGSIRVGRCLYEPGKNRKEKPDQKPEEGDEEGTDQKQTGESVLNE